MLPCVRRLSAADLPARIAALSLVHVTTGELVLRDAAGRHRLLGGELLAVRDDAEVELHAARGDVQAFLFFAPSAWVARARALVGLESAAGSGEALARAAAGSDVARRAGRLLLAAHLDACDDGAAGIAGAGRLVELVGIACAIEGSLLAGRPAPARGRTRRAALVRALEQLESASLEGVSLPALAEALGVSARHASRLLREELGTSLREYLVALRIERAKKRLATTAEPVTDVALETGWQSISHFNTVFRRRVGATPSAYRARSAG
jgi:AraC-like DNA-binding protein